MKILKFALLTGLFLSPVAATAKPQPYRKPVYASPETPSGVTLGLQAYDYSYEEPNFAYLDGLMYGLEFTYTHRFSRNYSFSFNADGAAGTLDYDSNGSGQDSGIWNYKGDFRLTLGRDFLIGRKFALSPFAGLGYRILFDNADGTTTTTGAFGYDRLSQYLYIPVGLSAGYTVGNWTIRPSAEYDIFIKGQQTSYLARAGFTDDDLENEQNSGYGVRASLMLETPTSSGLLSFGPFVRYWDIDDSEVDTVTAGPFLLSGIEPANTTTEVGAKINLRF